MDENVCRYRDHHPELEAQMQELGRRLTVVEGALHEREDARVEDLKEFTKQLGDVHEKVNKVALALAGVNGKLVMAAFVVSTGAGTLVFILGKIWR